MEENCRGLFQFSVLKYIINSAKLLKFTQWCENIEKIKFSDDITNINARYRSPNILFKIFDFIKTYKIDLPL